MVPTSVLCILSVVFCNEQIMEVWKNAFEYIEGSDQPAYSCSLIFAFEIFNI